MAGVEQADGQVARQTQRRFHEESKRDFGTGHSHLIAKVAEPLQTNEVQFNFRADWYSPFISNCDKKCVVRDCSLTGILVGRSYHPWRAVRSVIRSSFNFDKSVPGQAFDFTEGLDYGGPIKIGTVPFSQSTKHSSP